MINTRLSLEDALACHQELQEMGKKSGDQYIILKITDSTNDFTVVKKLSCNMYIIRSIGSFLGLCNVYSGDTQLRTHLQKHRNCNIESENTRDLFYVFAKKLNLPQETIEEFDATHPVQDRTSSNGKRPEFCFRPQRRHLEGSLNTARIQEIAQRDHLVCFYKNGPTQAFGNFAVCPNGIRIMGENFKTAEGAFQYAKYKLMSATPDELKPFIDATGDEAFSLNRELQGKHDLKEKLPKWETPTTFGVSLRDEVMTNILAAKFRDNPEMHRELMATGDAFLLETNPGQGRDNYWAYRFNPNDQQPNGNGNNRLGLLLMCLRDGKKADYLPILESQVNAYGRVAEEAYKKPQCIAHSYLQSIK